jgi:hypothetical protein
VDFIINFDPVPIDFWHCGFLKDFCRGHIVARSVRPWELPNLEGGNPCFRFAFSGLLRGTCHREALCADPSSSKRRLLLASDRSDQSSELANILQSVGEVDNISTSDIPDAPAGHFSGIVVDINLRSSESVQQVRTKLRAEAYRSMPRLFVLADALHHGSMLGVGRNGYDIAPV